MRKRSEIETAFAPREAMDGIRSFFLVGIGGAGMSALARMLKTRGYEVSGTDSTAGAETVRLAEEGISVHIGHSGDQLVAGMALILSDAIDLDKSPEVAKARELSVPILRRSQCLGWLLRAYKVIAITGTHGKTTTTGMTGMALVEAGFDPLVVVGASIPQWGGPVREGKGEWAVVEACEAYDSFHDLDPTIVVLTNLELDHVDFHGNWENLRASVVRFVNRLPADGKLIYCGEDAGASEIASLVTVPKESYGLEDWDRIIAKVPDLLFAGPGTPGRHNLLNAAAAAVVAETLGDVDGKAILGIARFHGAERRLQLLRDGEVLVIDDYAHHPTEIEASLKAVRAKWGSQRLIVVFQPHLYSRTAPLVREFAAALSLADEIVLTDIYPAREEPMPGMSSARIAEHVTKPVTYIPSRHLLPRKVAAMVRPGDVVVGMGAGNIGEFAPSLLLELDRLKRQQLGPKRVVVLYGGDSSEREVSLHSGRAIHAALTRLGHESRMVDMTDLLFTKPDLSAFIGPDRPDVVFLGTHGTHAEDGAIQGLLELLALPYTGSGIQASAIAMDKAMTKQILKRADIQVPKGVLLKNEDDPFTLVPPVIVKPNAQGSTVGLSFVEKGNDLCHAVRNAFAYDKEVLVEEWLRGMEISTPVLCGKALLPVEIAPASGKYDFESKYTPGATVEIVPARLPEHVLKLAQEIAVRAHGALGCSGATRTDAIVVPPVDGHGEHEIYVLEVNTLPGMTGTSLLPNSAAAVGISFDELCQRLLEDALARYEEKA